MSETAALLQIPSRRVWRWYRGYGSAGRRHNPVVTQAASPSPLEVSFLALAEGVVIRATRELGISLRRIRAARSFAQDRLGIDFPFASDVFRTDGASILYEFESATDEEPDGPLFVDVGERAAQTTLEGFITETVSLLTFTGVSEGWAHRFYPAGTEVPLYVDPTHRSGQLVTAADGIRAEAIWKRFLGGDEPAFIAKDLGTDRDQVQAVIDFMSRLRVAA